MTTIKWDDSRSVGVKIIDKQHKHFIGLLNNLYECLESNNTAKLPSLIKDLTSYTDHHFKTEEEYFDKFQYEDADAHKAAHKELKAKVRSFLDRKDDPKVVAFDLLYFLERWFLVHLKGMDKKYTKCFNQHGIH